MGAAAGPIISGVLGAGGLLMQNSANNTARNQQQDALAMQGQLTQRQITLFDRIQKRFEDMKAGGAFDPTKRLDQLDADTARYEGRDAGNLSGALRVSGYRAGDSEIGSRLDAVKVKYRSERERIANDIRRQSTNDELSAMQGQASMGSDLNSAIATYGNRASQFGQDIQSLGPAVGVLGQGLSSIFARAPKASGRATLSAVEGATQGVANGMPRAPKRKTRFTLPNYND